MANQIKWTERARDTHGAIIAYLEKEWSDKEVINFINTVEEKLRLIAIYPHLFTFTNKRRNIHKTVINKKVVLFYRIHNAKSQVELLIFWDTRQRPSRLKL